MKFWEKSIYKWVEASIDILETISYDGYFSLNFKINKSF